MTQSKKFHYPGTLSTLNRSILACVGVGRTAATWRKPGLSRNLQNWSISPDRPCLRSKIRPRPLSGWFLPRSSITRALECFYQIDTCDRWRGEDRRRENLGYRGIYRSLLFSPNRPLLTSKVRLKTSLKKALSKEVLYSSTLSTVNIFTLACVGVGRTNVAKIRVIVESIDLGPSKKIYFPIAS
jgi:hypothetical protein